MRNVTLEAYENWLREEGYQPSTVESTLRNLKAAAGAAYVHPQSYDSRHGSHVRRYLRFVLNTRKNPLGGEAVKYFRALGLAPSASILKTGARAKAQPPQEALAKIKSRLRRGGPSELLLVAYMRSGLRISEFLRLRLKGVNELTIPDKISRDWLLTFKSRGNIPIYKVVCPTERCTYYRLRILLRREAARLGVAIDFDTLYKNARLYGAEES
jgi:hypothetical protein